MSTTMHIRPGAAGPTSAMTAVKTDQTVPGTTRTIRQATAGTDAETRAVPTAVTTD